MEYIINILYAIILCYWSFKNQTKFVIAYLIYISSYLGWISRDIIIGGVEYGQLIFNIIPLLPVVKYWHAVSPLIKKIIIFVLIFYLYGLIKPIIDGNQGLLASVKSSKSITFYFFAYYVLVFNARINFRKVFTFVKYLALYFSILYILNQLGVGIKPIAYVKNNFIQCHYDSIIFLAICVVLMQEKIFNVKNSLLLLILSFGIYIGGYFSLFIMSIFIISFVIVYRKMKTIKKTILLCVFLLFILFLFCNIAIIDVDILKMFTNQIDAVDSRSYHNEFRWLLIEKQFWFGYGFISRESSIISLNSFEDSSYMRELTFIDAGYVDLLGRFGLIGTILFLLLPMYFIFVSIYNKQTIPLILLLMSFFAINFTWSVFTYSPGIIVLSLLYSFLYKTKKINMEYK